MGIKINNMINPFKPQKYIRVSDVMDMIAERENRLAVVKGWLDMHTKNDKHWSYYMFRSGRVSEEILLLRSVLKAKLKP